MKLMVVKKYLPAGLGDVVRRLLLWEVGNVAGHGSGDDEGSLALLLEVSTDSLGAVESPRNLKQEHINKCIPL